MSDPTYPVRDIADLLIACGADEALHPGDPRLYDFSKLLGKSVLAELADTLEQNSIGGRHHHCVLTGHRGSGKSTQLLELKKWADANGFLTVWNEVDVHFGLADLQFSDLFLLAAESVERTLRENGVPVPEAEMKHVVEWFAEVIRESDQSVKSTIETKAGGGVKGGLFSLGKLFFDFSAGVVAGSDRHLKVREKIRQAPNALIDLTNNLLRAAEAALVERGRSRGLLLLFDNLDRYPTDTIDKVLIKGRALTRRLGCHAVFTMPVDLRIAAGLPHQDAFDATTFLPMLPLRSLKKPWKGTVAASSFRKEAVNELLAALGRRIDVAALFEKPADAVRLVKHSGGCVRDLLHLVNQARQKSRTSVADACRKLTHQGVNRAVQDYRFLLVEGLAPEDYDRLARVARREPDAMTLDARMLAYIGRRRVLFYQSEGVNWYDVHPLLIEDEGFRRAFESATPDEDAAP